MLETETKLTIRMKDRARIDLIWSVLAIFLLIMLSIVLDVEFVESLYLFTRSHENWEMDEFIFSFLWIAIIAITYGIRRVIDIKEINKEIARQAYYDSLTNLPNRSIAQSKLENLLQHTKNSTICVVFIDLVNFKDINDAFGHDIGDILIKKVGAKLTSVVKKHEMVARLGGDEFLIIAKYPHNSPDIELLVKQVEQAQNQKFEINGRVITSVFSIGVALSSEHGDSVKSLLIAADSAMYEAKRNKSLLACYYSDEIGRKITDYYRLSSQLKYAIEYEQLHLVYQPIVNGSSGKIEGYEALTRWCLEDEFINPELIISIAEDIGASEDFFKWLLNTALKESAEFLKQDQFIAINVSVKQFGNLNFIENTRRIMSEHVPQRIEFEITESSLIANFEETIRRIDMLKTLGINVMIDDFGTGYSSLSRLKMLNVSKLKIDREFLNEAGHDPKSSHIYKSIVELAAKLGIDIVAEGVETKEQMLYLRQFNPIFLQGYLFQKPQIYTKQTSELMMQALVLEQLY